MRANRVIFAALLFGFQLGILTAVAFCLSLYLYGLIIMDAQIADPNLVQFSAGFVFAFCAVVGAVSFGLMALGKRALQKSVVPFEAAIVLLVVAIPGNVFAWTVGRSFINIGWVALVASVFAFIGGAKIYRTTTERLRELNA